MEYWRGYMNWQLDNDWKCEICGKNEGLTWGLVHAQCRCNICHTQYRMRNIKDEVISKPICQLKPEYYYAAKEGYEALQKPIDEFSDDEWQEALMKKD